MKNPTLPILLKDGYKVGHKFQYPNGTEFVYSNFTPRSSRIPGIDEVVFFGLQYFIKEYLINDYNDNFFSRPKDEVVAQYKRRIDGYLGPDAVDVSHIGALHDLGYLPLIIKAVPEGTRIPIRIPVFTVMNTHPDFFWLTNALETIISAVVWPAITSATIANEYLRVFNEYEKKTFGSVGGFVPWQGHDFSFRGMFGLEAAMISAAAHLLSFDGTDTIPAIDFLEEYYNANSDLELIGGSVAATEHSVMCMGGEMNERDTIVRLATEVYPTGIVSVVSDTWDFWAGLTEILPSVKDVILNREGKYVVRPDSGDPVKIICGDPDAPFGSPEFKGAIEVLWDTFGGVITETGHKLLDPHVGLIYGDSITMDRQKQILSGLEANGFSSYNVVLGIGSYTYQYQTRDTFGMAMKATWGQVNGVPKDIFKNPKTDDGLKKSAKGLISLNVDEFGTISMADQVSYAQESIGLLEPVFINGTLIKDQSLQEIRSRVRGL